MDKGRNTQQKIIQQASLNASVGGIHSLTIGTLATELNMSKSGLFAHFGSKKGLQKSVISAIFLQFKSQIIDPALALTEGKQQVKQLMTNWIEWSRDESRPGGCPIASTLFDTHILPDEIKNLLQLGMWQWQQTLTNTINNAKKIDLNSELNSHELALMLNGIYYSQHINFFLLADPKAKEHALSAIDALLS